MQKGQTLIEVLVTVLVIAIGVIAIIRFQRYLSYDNSLIIQKSDATILANSTMETLRDYQVLNNTSGYTSYQSIVTGSSTSTIGNTSYSSSWTVTTYTNPDYKNINVSVSWTDKNGSSQSVSLVSNVAGIEPSLATSII